MESPGISRVQETSTERLISFRVLAYWGGWRGIKGREFGEREEEGEGEEGEGYLASQTLAGEQEEGNWRRSGEGKEGRERRRGEGKEERGRRRGEREGEDIVHHIHEQ